MKPLSTGRKFLIVSLPSLTSVFPAGKGITSLIQVSLGGGYPSAWQVSCIWANSIFDTNDEGFLVTIGRPKTRRINMMWLVKAIVFTGLAIETTQNGYPLEEKCLCEFSRVQYTPQLVRATRTNNGAICASWLVSRLARVRQVERNVKIFIYTGCGSGWCMKKYCKSSITPPSQISPLPLTIPPPPPFQGKKS